MFEVVPAQQYPKSLLSLIENASSEIVFVSMVFLWDSQTKNIHSALLGALSRGVKVSIIADIYSDSVFAINPYTPTSLVSSMRALRYSRKQMLTLKENGAEVSYVGKMKLNPFKGRMHQKFTIVDNSVFLAGGINFSNRSFSFVDYMLLSNDHKTRSELKKIAQQLKNDTMTEHSITLSAGVKLLVDNGHPDNSIIYDRVVNLSRNAREVTYVSQRAPSGKLASVLQNVPVKYYFNRPSQIHDPSILSQSFDIHRYHLRNLYQGHRYIHAKYMLFDMNDGTKKVVSGSHNFTYQGVAYGTKEIAIESNSPSLWQGLSDFTSRFVSS